MTILKEHSLLSVAAIGLALFAGNYQTAYSDTTQGKEQRNPAPSEHISFTYPYSKGQLTFPQDEGKHSLAEYPFTLMEWFAHYTHLTAGDGSRYFLFTTFITYDPIEQVLHGKFPHMISTLINLNNGKTSHCCDMSKLAEFAEGHADTETTKGNYFRWKGHGKPFQYDYHVAWHDSKIDYTIDLELKMIKAPLVLNGTGYVDLPKGTSGYYSQTRLKATGHIIINGTEKKVHGIHWVDRQWLGLSFINNMQYSYEWWALQLDNNEEAIIFRIWDMSTDKIAMTLLNINHADGKQEGVDEFSLTDLSSGWHLSAPRPGWDVTIVPVRKGKSTWHSCDVKGTINGKPVIGLAVAELARNIGLGSVFTQALSAQLKAITGKQTKVPKQKSKVDECPDTPGIQPEPSVN